VSEEACGQLIFPVSLNDDLTIQNLGEVCYYFNNYSNLIRFLFFIHVLNYACNTFQIVTDRITYHTEDLIYPAGYMATKIYGRARNPKSKCLYTCKIIDDGIFPRFVEFPIFFCELRLVIFIIFICTDL